MEKLSDAEIMKGLECCSNDDGDNCEQCPYSDKVYEPGRGGCCNQLTDDTLGFVKRLQSENAELKSELTIMKNNFENAQKFSVHWLWKNRKWKNTRQKLRALHRAVRHD